MGNRWFIRISLLLGISAVFFIPGLGEPADSVSGSFVQGTSPVWDRVRDSGSTINASCSAAAPDSCNNAVPYAVHRIVTTSNENLSAAVDPENTAIDSFLGLYCSSFDPNAPSANMIAADDDGGGYPHAAFASAQNIALTACTPYDLVVSGYSASSGAVLSPFGTYKVDLGGTAQFADGVFELNVSKAGTGSGTVSGTNIDGCGGIDCGSVCAKTYYLTNDVTLTATPATGSYFAGWSGGGCTGTGTCVVTMNAAKSVTATFTLNTYTLTVSKAGTGGGVVTGPNINCGTACSATFDHGTQVTLMTAPDSTSDFSGWSGDCNSSGQVSMVSAKACTATFTRRTYQVTASAGTNGNLDSSTPSPRTVVEGSTAGFTFNANTGYHVAGVSGCGGTAYSNTSNAVSSYTYTTGAIYGTCTVNATFAINTYTVTTNATNGTITSTNNPTVNHGDTTTVTGSANTGYYFTGVSGCGGTAQTNSNQAVTDFSYTTGAVTSNCTVSATFAIKTYTVTTTANNGTITSTVNPTVNHGDTTTVTGSANTNYYFTGVSGCGGTAYTNTDISVKTFTYTTGGITGACTVTASFAADRKMARNSYVIHPEGWLLHAYTEGTKVMLAVMDINGAVLPDGSVQGFTANPREVAGDAASPYVTLVYDRAAKTAYVMYYATGGAATVPVSGLQAAP